MKGKLYFRRLYTLTSIDNLNFAERLTYSCLVDRIKFGIDYSIDQLTGLDTRTVGSATEALSHKQLVQDGQAQEPTGQMQGWFHWVKKPTGRWAWDIASHVSFSPAAGLTPGEAALYSLLRHLSEPYGPHQEVHHTSRAGLGKLLGQHRTTVGNNLLSLKAKELIDVVAAENRAVEFLKVRVFDPAGEQLALFADALGEIVYPEFGDDRAGEWENTTYAPIIRKVMAEDPNNRWLQAKFPGEVYGLVAERYYNGGNTSPDWLGKQWVKAKNIHAQHGTSKSCAKLLLSMVKKHIGKLECDDRLERREREGREYDAYLDRKIEENYARRQKERNNA